MGGAVFGRLFELDEAAADPVRAEFWRTDLVCKVGIRLTSRGVDRECVRAISCDGLEDGIGGLGPDERLGVVIVGLDEGGDVGLQFLDAAMNAALDLFVGEQREPAFNLVQPGSAGRREVQVIARVAGQPGPDRRRLVGGVIVEHQVDVETGPHSGFDRGEERRNSTARWRW